jgi:sugar lactone lactonase YvrE
MTELDVLVDGLAFPESCRWVDGRLWVSDWAAQQVLAVDADGTTEIVATVPSFPLCFDQGPDGRVLLVDANHGLVVAREPDGSLVPVADLNPVAEPFWNEIVVDGRGHAFVNSIGFDMGAGADPGPGLIACVDPSGAARIVAGDLAFPNGMAITPDDTTLIVGESYGSCLTAFTVAPDGSLTDRRVWAAVADSAPDGICLDADGAVWYADVPNEACVRVAEGGEVLDRVALDRGGFSCALGGPDGRTLFVATNRFDDETFAGGPGRGQVVTTTVAVPATGRP